VIEIEHVSKRFGRVQALADVSLQIEPGERVAFVGSNGSGKTTLLRALLGLLRVSGRICIAGHDVARAPELALAHVAYIPQISPPLDAPVSELVRAYCALRSMTLAGVGEHARALGLDVAAISALRFRDLSGGMKQKLLAALALATACEILVCDEPTANLDADAREGFLRALERRPQSNAVILCSHREQEVRDLANRIVELKDGHVVPERRGGARARGRLQVMR
jgi:ABC-type multidrug transport system ATPase subunit